MNTNTITRPPIASSVDLRQRILFFIADYRKVHGYGPSFDEIADGLGIVAPSYHLDALEVEGYISFSRLPSGYRITRSLQVTRKGEAGYG